MTTTEKIISDAVNDAVTNIIYDHFNNIGINKLDSYESKFDKTYDDIMKTVESDIQSMNNKINKELKV